MLLLDSTMSSISTEKHYFCSRAFQRDTTEAFAVGPQFLPINFFLIKEIHSWHDNPTDITYESLIAATRRTSILITGVNHRNGYAEILGRHLSRMGVPQEEQPTILEKLFQVVEVAILIRYVEEDMVDGFPYEIPEEYQSMPLLKGRATVDMKVKVKDNPNLTDCVFRIVLDGYNAPVTSGNFVDLVERHFYDGMGIQRADGFVVQTGDPEGPAEGFIDPSTEKTRTIPLEISVDGEKAPFYGATLEEFENNSASSQVFWLLKESELTPSNANILDGRYAVFGYITENENFLADLKVGDVIESIQVVSGLENLVNPSYKIAG
ncbi:hypothetical protein ACLB2K_057921 [Fragaria x ananassa]